MEKGKYIILKFCLCLASCCLGSQIDLENPPEEWRPLLAELARPCPVQSAFMESRSNPFHRLPRRFEGKLWWDPQIGLSLYYEKPSQLIINVLPDKVLMGHPGEPLTALPESQQQFMVLFSKLLNWETAWLNSNFSISGELNGPEGWHLSLQPHDEELSGNLERIDLDGENGWLNRIYLNLPGGRAVEIKLSGQRHVRQLSEGDIHQAFPNHGEQP